MNRLWSRSCIGAAAVAAAAMVVVGCGSESAPPPSSSVALSPSMNKPVESTPTVHLGETLEIASTGNAIGVTEYTIGNPRLDDSGRYVVDVALNTVQGSCIPGSFFVLTTGGAKLEAIDSSSKAPGRIDTSGTLIEGEKRSGTLTFDTPAGAQVSKLILYHGTVNPPKAFWLA